MAKKTQTFETALKRLEEITDLMEDPSIGIKNLVDYYKEAVDLTNFLNETLNKYEMQVTELTKAADGFLEKDFESDADNG